MEGTNTFPPHSGQDRESLAGYRRPRNQRRLQSISESPLLTQSVHTISAELDFRAGSWRTIWHRRGKERWLPPLSGFSSVGAEEQLEMALQLVADLRPVSSRSKSRGRSIRPATPLAGSRGMTIAFGHSDLSTPLPGSLR